MRGDLLVVAAMLAFVISWYSMPVWFSICIYVLVLWLIVKLRRS